MVRSGRVLYRDKSLVVLDAGGRGGPGPGKWGVVHKKVGTNPWGYPFSISSPEPRVLFLGTSTVPPRKPRGGLLWRSQPTTPPPRLFGDIMCRRYKRCVCVVGIEKKSGPFRWRDRSGHITGVCVGTVEVVVVSRGMKRGRENGV